MSGASRLLFCQCSSAFLDAESVALAAKSQAPSCQTARTLCPGRRCRRLWDRQLRTVVAPEVATPEARSLLPYKVSRAILLWSPFLPVRRTQPRSIGVKDEKSLGVATGSDSVRSDGSRL